MPRSPLPILLLAALLGACATPIAPSGGPADTTPPTLVSVTPADGATNVSERTLTLTFSERIAPAAAGAVTVTPPGEAPPEVRVRGRDVEVTFPALRDSTTYVVTVGTELRDQRNVPLREPITVAFATGDVIDRGRLVGAVRDPQTGAPAAGLAVWAYAAGDTTRLPDVRQVAPDYQTETGADGAFRLDYLRAGRYFVAAVADRNRNRRVDPGEAFAAPPRPALATVNAADSTAAAPVAADFWTTALDTIAPVAQRVRPISDRRFAVRFSEAVRLADPAAGPLVVTDSLTGRPVEATLYQPPDAPFEVFVQTAQPLAQTVYRVASADTVGLALVDSVGTPPAPFSLSFTPTALEDTLQARFVRFLPPADVAADSVQTLVRGQRPGVRFTAPLAPDERADRVTLIPADGVPLPVDLQTNDGVSFRITAETDDLPQRFSLTVASGDSTRTRRYAFLDESETGGIVGRVESDSGAVLVEVRPEAGGEPTVVTAGPDGAFAVAGLAPGAYRLRVFADLDGDGRWDGGSLVPYRPAEPLRILPDAVTVRARWDTDVPAISLQPTPGP